MSEEPKIFFKKQQPGPAQNRKIILTGIAVLCLAALLFASLEATGKKKEGSVKAKGQETKEVYSKTEIENLIKEQLLEVGKQEVVKATTKAQAPKRKFDAGIAVFVKKEEKEDRAKANTQKSQELGVPTGVKIKAHLANAIFSFNVTSPVIAVSDEDTLYEGGAVIPKGTQFIGEAGIVQSRDRVNIRFSIMVMPGGKESRIKAMALSLDGSGGIKGKVDKQYDRSILKATGEMLLSGASLVLGTRRGGPVSLEDELRMNASRNLADDAQGALNNVRIEKSISVEAYTPILILLLDKV